MDDERITLTEREAYLGNGRTAKRTVYVNPTDGAEVCVEWTGVHLNGPDTLSLEPDDLDQLCLWWLRKGRPAYRAFVRQFDREHAITRTPDDWIERTPDNLHVEETG